MKMSTSGGATIAESAYDLSTFDGLPRTDAYCRKVGVAGLVAVVVVNDDDSSIATLPACVGDGTVACAGDGGAVGSFEVNAFVWADTVGDGVASV